MQQREGDYFEFCNIASNLVTDTSLSSCIVTASAVDHRSFDELPVLTSFLQAGWHTPFKEWPCPQIAPPAQRCKIPPRDCIAQKFTGTIFEAQNLPRWCPEPWQHPIWGSFCSAYINSAPGFHTCTTAFVSSCEPRASERCEA